MNRANGRLFLAERLRSDWSFIEKLHDADPEVIHRFLHRSEVPFLRCATAPGTLYRKYLEYTGKAAEFRDKNGNTLLHAALLRGLFEGRTAFFESSHHSRECYDHLIEKGCSPETKNNAGVSCNDLLAQFRARREELCVR